RLQKEIVGQAADIPVAVAAACRDRDEVGIRRTAAAVLAAHPDPQAAEALCGFADDRAADVRIVAVRGLVGLARTEGGAAFAALVRLVDDPDVDVACWAAEGVLAHRLVPGVQLTALARALARTGRALPEALSGGRL